MTAAVGIRHDDWRTRQANTRWSGTADLPGNTELTQQTRHGAQDQFAESMRRLGAEQALAADITMRIWEIESGERYTDHVCEVTITGTRVAAFGRAAIAPALTVLPLSARPARVRQVAEPDVRPAARTGPWRRATGAVRAARVNRALDG